MTENALTENQLSENAQIRHLNLVGSYIGQWIDDFFGVSYNRNLIKQFRYPKINQEAVEAIYRSGDIANRIGKLLPEQTWAEPPRITDMPDRDDDAQKTPFEDAIDMLDEEHDIFGWMRKADEVMAYADYVALRIQIADGSNSMEPFRRIPGKANPEALTFITVHSAANATFAAGSEETDMNSRNYGMPQVYNLEPNVANKEIYGVSALQNLTVPVHASKIVHMAENLDENTLIGYSRLRKMFYRLYDLQKIMASSSESFYQGARNPYVQIINSAAKTLQKSGVNMSKAEAEIADQAMNALKDEFVDTLTVRNADIKPLNPAIANPKDAGDLALRLISAATGIPKEILEGNVLGLRGGEANSSLFTKMIEFRQKNFASRTMLRPFVKRLIEMNVLPEPNGGRFVIEWPDMNQASTKDMMAAFNQFANAAKALGHTPENPIFTHEQIAEQAGKKYMAKELVKQREEAAKLAEERMARAQAAMGDAETDSDAEADAPNPGKSNANSGPPQAKNGDK